MPGNVITIQVGQCGNKLGAEFWRTMSEEHGIGPDGTLLKPDRPGVDRKEMFFCEVGPSSALSFYICPLISTTILRRTWVIAT